MARPESTWSYREQGCARAELNRGPWVSYNLHLFDMYADHHFYMLTDGSFVSSLACKYFMTPLLDPSLLSILPLC